MPVDSDTSTECFRDSFDVRSGGHNAERNVNDSQYWGIVGMSGKGSEKQEP